MLSEGSLRRALERGPAGRARYDEVTGLHAGHGPRARAAGTPEWTLVAAGHQTGGRGRLGRTWSDEPGRALMFSVVLRPELDLRAGVCPPLAARHGDGGGASRPRRDGRHCKWPNDVLVDGRKAAGILAESSVADGRFEHVVLGIGANLGAARPTFRRRVQCGRTRPSCSVGSCRRSSARTDRGTPTSNAVTAAHAAVSATLDVRPRRDRAAVVEGEAVSLDERGGLVVRTASGERSSGSSEVEHLE